MRKLTLHILLLIGLATLSSCDQETRVTSPSASPSPQTTSQAAATGQATEAGSAATSGGGSGGSSSTSSNSQTTGGSTTQARKTPQVEVTPKVPNLTPSQWRKKNFKARPFKDFAKLPGYSVVRVLTPQPATSTTLRSGKKMYENSCILCHGATGTPPNRDAALVRYNMADLSQPHQYKFGSGERAIFRSIAYGVDAPVMPPLEDIYTKQQIWDLVNYIRTLQK